MLNKLQMCLLPAYAVILVGGIIMADLGAGHRILGLVHQIP